MSNDEPTTPETDAARDQYQRELWSGKHQAPHTTTMVPIEFARQMERDRNNLREALHLATGTADLALKHRDAAETVIAQIRDLVTEDHETKDSFIRRVRACLPADPFPEKNQ